jgi:hypothetical protein
VGHLNDHRSTISLVERYIGTPYDDIKQLLDNLPQLLELLAFFKSYSIVDAKLEYDQSQASDTWVIHHNFGKYPSVETVDNNKNEMEGEVVHTDNNTLTIYFNEPVSGFAYIN